jgi:hypothetical protein
MTTGAHSDFCGTPRDFITLKDFPSIAFAAVAPRQTMISGCRRRISASSQGKQARTSPAPGVLWMRFLLVAARAHLKCLTAFVR